MLLHGRELSENERKSDMWREEISEKKKEIPNYLADLVWMKHYEG